jgi:hypothetical protein
MCLSAGEALPEELYRRWVETFNVEIYDGIGSAEMFHIYITNRPGDVKPGSLGRVVEGYEAEIVDADGRAVPTGEMGTLRIKGDSAALCYWQAHEKSKQTFAGDWCTTGDQFHVGRRWLLLVSRPHRRHAQSLGRLRRARRDRELPAATRGRARSGGRRPRRGRSPRQAQGLRRPPRRPRGRAKNLRSQSKSSSSRASRSTSTRAGSSSSPRSRRTTAGKIDRKKLKQ